MTDFSTSAIAAPAPSVGSSFDVTNLDRTLREINAVERSWTLPRLPDAVKLDLMAFPEVEQQGIGVFLRGIDSDFNPEPEPEPTTIPTPLQLLEERRSGMDQFRVNFAGIAGEPAPTAPSVDAVEQFKLRAVEKGYLPEGTTIDPTWSPELNSIRGEMAFDDYNDRLRGNRPGAVSTNTAIDILGKWTSPTGLLAAATELDLFWDFGAIGGEISSWGDKWRKLDEAKNPFDFGAKLVDALTGPLDDIIVPAANWLLLGSGVGAVTNTARIGFLASKGFKGASMVSRLYDSAAGVFNVTSKGNLAALAEKSWMAGKLQRSSSGAVQGVGNAMEAWRATKVARTTKGVTQFGMRAGFLSQSQDLLPGYQGGVDLSGLAPVSAVNKKLNQLYTNPAMVVPELLIAPYNIFTPGTFLRRGGEGLGAVSRTASGLFAFSGGYTGKAVIGGIAGLGVGIGFGDGLEDGLVGAAAGAVGAASLPIAGEILGSRVGVPLGRSVAGAAAGAGVAFVMDPEADAMDLAKGAGVGFTLISAKSIYRATALKGDGTGKYIGHVSDFLKHTSFAPLADNQQVSASFHRALTKGLPEDQLKVYNDAYASTGSVKRAIGAVIGGDDEAVGAQMAFVMASAALDHTARVQATPFGDNWKQAYHTFRNKMVAQLTTFDVENMSSGTIFDMARARAFSKTGDPKKVAREFQQALEDFSRDPSAAIEWANAHNETARATMRQLMSPENLPGLGQQLNVGAPDLPGGVPQRPPVPDMDEGLSVLDAYLPQVMDTFGNWTQFDAQTHEISQMLGEGLFEAAKFKTAKNQFDRPMRGFRKDDVLPESQVSNGVVGALFGGEGDVVKLATKGRFSALANLSPHGRMTAARVGTPVKQDFIELSDKVQGLRRVDDSLAAVDARQIDIAAIDSQIGKRYSEDTIRSVLKQAGQNAGSAKSVKRIIDFARHHDLSMADLRVQVNAMIEETASDVGTWQRLGLDDFAKATEESGRTQVLHGREALDARYKELAKKERFAAAEIDLDDLLENTTGTERERILALKEGLENDGYKLVHGVQFMMPHDLAKSDMFADVSRRNLNAVTFGNFFKGRTPIARKALEERRIRSALSRKFIERGIELDGAALDPESDLVGNVLADLNRILEDMQDRSANIVDNLHQYNWWQRRAEGITSSFVPLRLEDLSRKQAAVIGTLEANWGPEIAEAAWLAVPEFRNAEFSDVGLYAIEAKLRSQSQLAESIKFLSGTRYGESVATVAAARQATIGAGIGAATGIGDEDGMGNNALIGGVAGAVSGLAGGKALAETIPRTEMFRFGYLADNLAVMRDTLRFTLSPFFDISRYSEGYVLGQTAAPLRNPKTGERIYMPLNASPSKLRKTMKKEMLKPVSARSEMYKDLPVATNPVEAERMARQQYDDIVKEFRAAVRVDFDPDELDQTGRWFKQVGMAGFSPTDWTATAYAHLRTNGIDPNEAYVAARNMYTYGTRGRSAAEMSANFVFFPFSFQKKALTHIGKWMNDDLARSIMIHDGLKMYEALDEEYNLGERWKEHVPLLQQLNKLNLFAYGISPGRFGGINSQLIESAGRGALALFTPQGVSLKNAAENAELQKLWRQALPLMNDVDWMVQNMGEQGHVLMGGSWQTTRADITDGYAQWNEYKSDMGQQLAAQGFTWSDLYNKPYLAELKAAYDLKRAELSSKYPAWADSRKNSTANRVANQMERQDRLARAAEDPENADPLDIMMAGFERELETLREGLKYQGVPVGGNDGWADAPPEVARYITSIGVDMLRQNPKWQTIWDRYYRGDHGVLEALI